MIEGVPRRDFVVRKKNHANKKSPLWARINARTRRPCCRRRSLRISVILTNNEAGRAKFNASLLSPADWSASKVFRLPARYPSARTKNTGSSAPTSPPTFMNDPLSVLASCIEVHLCSKSEDNGAIPASAHVGVILDHQLQKEHVCNVQHSVEVNALLGLERRQSRREEVRTQAVSYIAQRHGVVNVQRQRLVEAQSRREQRVVAVDIRRSPVVGKRRVQTPCFFRVCPPESLARHPIQEVVARPRCRTCRRREVTGIIGGAKLIEAGIPFSSFDVVKGADRRCLLARSKADLRNTHWSSAELGNQSRWVMRERRPIPCQHHRFDIEVVDGRNTNLHRRRGGRDERLDSRE